jgi:hypothetical protein
LINYYDTKDDKNIEKIKKIFPINNDVDPKRFNTWKQSFNNWKNAKKGDLKKNLIALLKVQEDIK